MESMIMKKLSELLDQQENIALVMITNAYGSSPRGVGAMMIVDSNGKLVEGTIGGGSVEEKAKQHAVECIARGISKTVSFNLNNAAATDKPGQETLDMVCGGKVEVFIRVFRQQDKLVIAGAGHIAEKLHRMAKILGYYVTIVDNREELTTRDRFPDADQLLVGNIADQLSQIAIDGSTSIVIVTHGHRHDAAALEAVIDSNAGYIGMIGSTNKVKACFNLLKEKGISESKLARVYSPIGIDIGGETPEEISLAIMAEIQAVKYGKPVPSLKLMA
jgi:xanthine dehydrogenase accessory factor